MCQTKCKLLRPIYRTWHHKASARSRLLVAGQPTSECLGRLTSGPTTDRSSSPTPCHEWIAVVGASGAVQPKTNIPPGPPSGGLSAEQRYFYLIGATLRGILGQAIPSNGWE